MNLAFTPKTTWHIGVGLIPSIVLFSALSSVAQTVSTDPPYSVVDRGPFYQVLQRTVSVTDGTTGQVSQQVQSYTMLQDGMNYLNSGQWIEAQDLVEATPTGAQAVHGQMTGNFNSDITSSGAISLSTATEVFQSHPIGLFYADSASGKMTQIGAVQSSVGILYSPNIIVFSNAIPGLADVMLVWAKNGFEQNPVLKKNPPPPSAFSMSSSTTTLQLWTAMDSCPVPREQRPVLLDSGLEDHILFFGSAWFPVGAAFVFGETPLPAVGQPAQVKPMRPTHPGVVPVAKSLVTISGDQVLIEEVRYSDLAPALSQLPQASSSTKANQTVELADRATFLRPSSKAVAASHPMQLASTEYNPKGVVLDFMNLSGSANSFTFTNNKTYHISSSFSVGSGTATFQQNACIKLDTNAYLLVSGNVSCSTSGSPTVFTSSDDNGYGQAITNSTANPGYAAAEDIWMYYQTVQTTLQNLRVRWAQVGIRYDDNGTLNKTPPQLVSTSLEDNTTGIYLNIGAGETLGLSQDTYCNVATTINDHQGSVSGSITQNCGVVSVAMVNDPNRDKYDYDTNKNSQTECSFAVLDSTNIVAAFMNTHLSAYGLGGAVALPTVPTFPGIPSPRMTSWAVSRNGGASFTDNGPLLPVSTITNGSTVITNGAPNPTLGDAGDTSMAYDSQSNVVYLLVNPSREPGFWQGPRLWTSNNKGTNFTLINTNVPNSTNVTGVDGPRIQVVSGGTLYVTGKTVSFSPYTDWIARSTNGGINWDSLHGLSTNGGSALALQVPDANGTIYAFWMYGMSGTNGFGYAWLSGTNWSSPRQLTIPINSTNGNGSGNPLRFNGDDPNDFFISTAAEYPVFANTNIYLVWADLPTTNSTTDHGDIFLAELNTNSDHSLSLSTIRKVNNDRTSTDQWNPSIAVNPGGTELFIGYYSRQEDPVTNSWIRAYGAKVYITNGLANATFECFPIGATTFLPMFAGTNAATNAWSYDPVWAQYEACLDTNAVYAGLVGNYCDCTWPNYTTCYGGCSSAGENVHFCADDYTWAASDSNYFYFAWCDRSRTFGQAPTIRPDADVNFAKIKQ